MTIAELMQMYREEGLTEPQIARAVRGVMQLIVRSSTGSSKIRCIGAGELRPRRSVLAVQVITPRIRGLVAYA